MTPREALATTVTPEPPAGEMLNLACGTKRHEGAVNMDLLPLEGVDVVHDAMDAPWPFAEARFAKIVSEHFFEHIPHHHASGRDGFLVVMEECWRVLKPGGLLVVTVPHHRRWRENLRDPTHTRVIHPAVWSYFDPSTSDVPTFYTGARFELVRMSFTRWRARGRISGYLMWRFPSLQKHMGVPVETTFTLRKAGTGGEGA